MSRPGEKTAVFVSPHLDDVAFSCGGTLAKLALSGWRCVLVTCFTRSVPRPRGFALACQLDKGLPPDVDYMELRRAEDRLFCRRIGSGVRVVHLDHPEAPHRGYGSAASLFGGVLAGDAVWSDLARELAFLLVSENPALLFLPQGLGNHVDHLQAIQAIGSALEDAKEAVPSPKVPSSTVLRYRDAPYAMRVPEAKPPAGEREVAVSLGEDHLLAKLNATEAYASQLGFQFGGTEKMRACLTKFAEAEAKRTGAGTYTEAFGATEDGARVVEDLFGKVA